VQDVDFENLVLHIRRSVVAMVEGAPKTEASLKDVPLDAQTAESLLGMEAPFSIRKSRRLVVCLSAHERPTALLARHAVAVLRQAGLGTCQGDEASLVSHLPAHVWNAPERERRKIEGRTGVAAPRESESHDDVYMQAVGPQKREAQSNLVKLVRRGAVSDINPA